MKTTKYQLKNGLQVILTESHKSPVVSVQMWVRTGSADERKGEEGLSHFIEHLVFKGTRQFKVGEIAATIEGAGGELNAYTSFDQTVFYVTMSKQFSDLGLTAIAEMMGFPAFDKGEIDNEREVVIEEIKRGKDSLGRAASEALFSNNYRKHAYGLPVIGFEKNIRDVSVKKIKDYFNSRYVPQNMFLLVSGDFSTPDMKKKVQKLFGEFHPYKLRKVVRTKEPKQIRPRVKVEPAAFEQSLGYVSFKIPSIKHKDIPALDVLSMIMGQGDTSRLVRKMRIENAIVNSVGCSTYTPLDDGLFAISFGYNKEKLPAALDAIEDVTTTVLKTEPTQDEISRAVLNIESEEFYSLETVDGLSRKFGSLEFYFKDLDAQKKYINAIRAIKPKDLLKVARKYMTPKTMCVSVVTKPDESSAVKKVQKDVEKWASAYGKSLALAGKTKVVSEPMKKLAKAPALKAQKVKSGQDEIRKVKLDCGVNVLLSPSQEAQIISAKVAMLGGLRIEPDNKNGAMDLFGRTWACGTKTRSEQDISLAIEKMAAGLGPVVGRNSVGLGMDLLTPFQQQGSDLFLDVLLNPKFPSEPVEREKSLQIEQIKNRKDNPSQACVRRFMEKMFAGHPYAKDMLGSPTALAETSSQDLHKIWQQHLQTQNVTFAIGGNFDADMWLEKIEAHFKGMSAGKKLLNKMPLAPLPENIRLYEVSQKEQSHVVYGFRALSLDDPDRYTLQIMQSILAGQGGRLFLELRDKNSLAYSVSPMRMEGVEAGYFGAYIGCSPEKVSKALQMMQEQFDLLCNEKLSAAELERAQRYIVGRHDIDLQRTSSVTSAILYNDIYGIDYNEPFTSAEKYFAITSDDVQRLAQKIFAGKSVTSVVGPLDPFKG